MQQGRPDGKVVVHAGLAQDVRDAQGMVDVRLVAGVLASLSGVHLGGHAGGVHQHEGRVEGTRVWDLGGGF